jgi:hypothetical protein
MADLLFRTEDMRQEDVLSYLVDTPTDRALIEALKGRSPVVLKGSRGVGKSFLMRATEAELTRDFDSNRSLPVYVTFARAGLIRVNTPDQFLLWMMSKLCNRIVRAASTFGLTLPDGSAISQIQGGSPPATPSKMEMVERIFEESWKTDREDQLPILVPDPEVLRDAVEDLCRHAGIERVVLFIDEAAHVFIPEQQRQFFTLMRDLRSPYLTVKAAVYPGATSYGESFQPSHDSTVLSVDRSVTDDEYASSMREMVYKQDATLGKQIEHRGEVFDTLAYAATGNPRILLKTLSRSIPFSARGVQAVVREYYREDIWAEHSGLAERYPGHRDIIDWGRKFLEGTVLPELYTRNRNRSTDASSYFWIHRGAPQSVHEGLRLLCYSGILQEGVSGIRATRSEVGTRYMVNLGCQFALDADPVAFGARVKSALSLKRMIEYGANHSAYRPIDTVPLTAGDREGNQALDAQLGRSIDRLDVTAFQRQKLHELGLVTIGDVLGSGEDVFQKAHYVGPVRARQMRNSAVAAVLEYLSG